MIRALRRRSSGTRLNLGCGDKLLKGYVNVDLATSRKGVVPNLLADLRALPFCEETVDEILAVHVIEHFYPWELPNLLGHWRHLLKPNGALVLECPNILSAARALVEDETLAIKSDDKRGQLVMWPLYGDPGWSDPLMCHRWGYTPRSLKEVLLEFGFQHVRQEPAQFKRRDPRDMRIVGMK